jgi:hypothetical protein
MYRFAFTPLAGLRRRLWPRASARVAALFYSLIESANLARVESRAYLREAILRAIRNAGAVTLARDLKKPES